MNGAKTFLTRLYKKKPARQGTVQCGHNIDTICKWIEITNFSYPRNSQKICKGIKLRLITPAKKED